MLGKIISIVIGFVIVYFTVRVLLNNFREVKEGKCTGCSGNCKICSDVFNDNAAEL